VQKVKLHRTIILVAAVALGPVSLATDALARGGGGHVSGGPRGGHIGGAFGGAHIGRGRLGGMHVGGGAFAADHSGAGTTLVTNSILTAGGTTASASGATATKTAASTTMTTAASTTQPTRILPCRSPLIRPPSVAQGAVLNPKRFRRKMAASAPLILSDARWRTSRECRL
jgi:hypothetical protein